MEQIFYIVIGWFLGLFGQFGAELIQRPYRREQIRRSIVVELRELRFKMAGLAFLVAGHNGTVNRAMLRTLSPILSADKSVSSPWFDEKNFELLLRLSDEQLSEATSGPERRQQSLILKKAGLPFLSAQVTSLTLFSPEFQRAALEVLGDLSYLNEEIDKTRFNFEKTFDSSLSSINRQLIHTNLNNSYGIIVEICFRLIERINYLLVMKK